MLECLSNSSLNVQEVCVLCSRSLFPSSFCSLLLILSEPKFWELLLQKLGQVNLHCPVVQLSLYSISLTENIDQVAVKCSLWPSVLEMLLQRYPYQNCQKCIANRKGVRPMLFTFACKEQRHSLQINKYIKTYIVAIARIIAFELNSN